MITNVDLLKDISQQQLLELSDLNATGEIDQDVIDDSINDAISFIESYIILPLNPTKLLKKIIVQETIYELRAKNRLLSDEDKELRKENESKLYKMSVGKLITEERTDTSTPVVSSNYAFRHRPRKKVRTRGFR
ncbi:phage protein Gp36 family protein [Halarcobacter sp.]|uniref:phage protein Gp36 family protein n=1 Tax=Halarcobacter sp. TaxID=2321133 RepID=UPI0029F498AA|nr:phage protein Gp36 family protein [Halarcobacter sp.]